MTGGQDKSVVLWNPHRSAAPGAAPPGGAAGTPGDPTPTAPSALLVQRFAGQHGGEVVDIAISADGGRFASAGGGDKCAVVWDTGTGNVIRKLFGHDGRLASCAWNNYAGGEASVLVTGGEDKVVRAWDLRAPGREPAQAMREASDSITAVHVEGPPGGAPPAAAGAEPSAVRIVSSSMDGCVRTYDVRRAACTVDAVGPPIATSALAHSGAAVLVSTFGPRTGGGLLLIDRSSALVLNSYAGHANSAYRLGCCLMADDARVASGSEDGRLCVWDTLAQPGAPPVSVLAHGRAVSWVEPHPRPGVRALLTASFDGTAKLWAPPGVLEDA